MGSCHRNSTLPMMLRSLWWEFTFAMTLDSCGHVEGKSSQWLLVLEQTVRTSFVAQAVKLLQLV